MGVFWTFELCLYSELSPELAQGWFWSVSSAARALTLKIISISTWSSHYNSFVQTSDRDRSSLQVMASKSQSRNSSPKISVRRPKLLRASATAPSLATSNASRKDLASLHCQSSGAATLLTRMASSSSAQLSYEHTRAQRASVSSGSFCVRDGQQSPESAHMERKEPFEIVIQQCMLSE